MEIWPIQTKIYPQTSWVKIWSKLLEQKSQGGWISFSERKSTFHFQKVDKAKGRGGSAKMDIFFKYKFVVFILYLAITKNKKKSRIYQGIFKNYIIFLDNG